MPKNVKVKVTYEFANGLRTTIYCLRPAQIGHVPYTCKPKKTKVKLTYEHSKGLQTTLHLRQEIILKHYVCNEKFAPESLYVVKEYDIHYKL